MKRIHQIAIPLLIFVFFACEEPTRMNPADRESEDHVVSFTVSRSDGSEIAAHESFTIEFDEAMTYIAPEVLETTTIGTSTFSWNEEEDLLTVAPDGLWAEGEDRSLRLRVDSAEGIPLEITLTYDVVNAVFVSKNFPGADDGNVGTSVVPLKTIQAGIDKAEELYSTAEVRVAGAETEEEGTYSSSGTIAVMVEGISLLGGYNSDFSSRNSNSYETILQDTRTTGAVVFEDAISVVSFPDSGITSNTVLDGFTIKPGSGEGCIVAIKCIKSDPAIRNNVIIGNAGKTIAGIYNDTASPLIEYNDIFSSSMGVVDGVSESESHGIYLIGSSVPVIRHNTIYGGEVPEGGSATNITYGIYDSSSGAEISFNNIYGTTPPGTINSTLEKSYGIYVDGANTKIMNNNIDSGVGITAAVSVGIYGSSSPRIETNTIYLASNDLFDENYLFGIYVALPDSIPASVTGNNFDGYFGSGSPNTGYYYDYGTIITDFLTEISIGAGDGTLESWGNYSDFNSNN